MFCRVRIKNANTRCGIFVLILARSILILSRSFSDWLKWPVASCLIVRSIFDWTKYSAVVFSLFRPARFLACLLASLARSLAGLLACVRACLHARLLECSPCNWSRVSDGRFRYPRGRFSARVVWLFSQGDWDAEDLRLLSLAQDLPRESLTTIRRGTWALLEAFLDRAPSPGGG